nr:delta12 fatty acid desaturase [Bemisia tabaci]
MGVLFPTDSVDVNGNCLTPERAPAAKPPFTLADLRKAVPPHCFERNLLRSFKYVFYDLSALFAIAYAASFIPLLPLRLQYVLWPTYWLVAGTLMLGVWILGHECGHHAFSDFRWVDGLVGFVLHSCMLTPYFSWKLSHGRHRANSASVERNEVYVARKRESVPWFVRYFNNAPGHIFNLTVSLLVGWPLYLTLNVSGRNYDKFVNHFYPSSPIYPESKRFLIFLSDVGVAVASYGLCQLALTHGLPWLLRMYAAPLLVCNAWFVTVTYLNHTHPALPHYDSSEWDWLRGALSTVDRDFGFLNHVFHHVTDSHIAHHLFPQMSHYHTVEATKALRPILGEYFVFDGTPIWESLYRETKKCVYVEPDERSKGVWWFSDKFE